MKKPPNPVNPRFRDSETGQEGGRPLKQTAPDRRTYPIGTEHESSLHRALKFRYSQGGEAEIPLGEYVCDGRTDEGEIIEVQTGSFGPLKEKAPRLTLLGPVRIIHPIAVQKFIELYDTEGNLIRRRNSPQKGSPWDLFKSLLYAPALPLVSGISIELALVDVLEKRISDGQGSWRRKGISISDKVLVGWRESILLEKPRDYSRFIPFKDDETFTATELGKKAKINSRLAGKTLYVLTKMERVIRIGKKGRSWLYLLNRA